MKKYIVGIMAGAVLVGGVWYYVHTNMMGEMDDMMMGGNQAMQTSGESLTKLPDEEVEFVKPTEIVELKDGDTYDMEATIVKQEVGNRVIKRLAYNGQIPGPVLKVQKDAKVTINFTNNIDMDTALHSHGLRGRWEFDGAVPITPPVKVGETFSYELEFPDTGVYWYHPHVREDYQQELGLYGNMIVEEEDYWSEADQEAYLIVDDFLEGGDFTEGVVTKTLMGRFGDKLLINDSEDYELTVNAGEITRAYITNVANTRTFDLDFEGSLMKRVGGDIGRIEKEEMIDSQIIGTAERYILELFYEKPGTYPIMHRGEKMGTVIVLPGTANRKADFVQLRKNLDDYTDIRTNVQALLARTPDKNLRLDIEMKNGMNNMDDMMSGGMMGGMNKEDADDSKDPMVDGDDHDVMHEHCVGMPGMGGCDAYTDHDADKKHSNEMMMNDTQAEHSSSETDDGIEWEDDMAMMNSMSNSEMMQWVIEDTDTGNKNEKINWSFKQNDLVKVRIYNDENGMHPMQHPIHFHGQRFVVLSEDGVLNDNLQWKDTVLIPKGKTVDILVDMSNTGKWMAHCHIAEHLHAGMMFQFQVR